MEHPIIVLGAARSGTKLLRSMIAAAGAVKAVPFDVNFIWRYGNEHYPHDELPARMATGKTRHYIRKQMPLLAGIKSDRPCAFVEKTVSNILRIPFVHEVFPEAKYVFLIRDGRDVIESVERCWREPPRAAYMLKKMRVFPWRHCAGYGLKHLRRVSGRVLGLSKAVASWGPRYEGLDEDSDRLDLIEICARQWAACLDAYERDRDVLAPDQVLEVRYEHLMQSPRVEIERIADFLQFRKSSTAVRQAAAQVQNGNIGKHRRLSPQQLMKIQRIAGATLDRWQQTTAEPLRHAA